MQVNRKHSYPSGILRIALAYLNITFHIFFFLFARFIGYLSAMSVYFLLNWWKFSWLLDPRWWLESASPDWRGVPAIDLVNWHLPVLDCYAICGEGERGCWCWSLCESKYLMRRGVDRVKQCSAVNACVWEIIWGSTVLVHLCRLACSVTCLTKTTPCPFFSLLSGDTIFSLRVKNSIQWTENMNLWGERHEPRETRCCLPSGQFLVRSLLPCLWNTWLLIPSHSTLKMVLMDCEQLREFIWNGVSKTSHDKD